MIDLTEKFNLPHVRGELMDADDVVYVLVWADVLGQAQQGNLPIDLTEEEMRTFRTCLESGLECWAEIVQLSLMAAIVGREDAPGAIGRANRFAATGDTNVLLEGLEEYARGGPCPDCGSKATTIYPMDDEGATTLYCDDCKREEP